MPRSKFLMVAAVAAIAALVAPATSKADFVIQVSDGTTTFNATPVGNAFTDTFTFTYANGSSLEVTLNAASNSPGAGGTAQVSQISSTVKGGGNLAAKDITIKVISDPFVLNPLNGTLTTSLASSNLNGTKLGADSHRVAGFSLIDGSKVTGSDVALDNKIGGFSTIDTAVSYGASFSLGNQLVIHVAAAPNSQVAPGTELANVNLTSTITPTIATPAPAGLVMLATALPFAGLLRRRLRKSEVATAA